MAAARRFSRSAWLAVRTSIVSASPSSRQKTKSTGNELINARACNSPVKRMDFNPAGTIPSLCRWNLYNAPEVFRIVCVLIIVPSLSKTARIDNGYEPYANDLPLKEGAGTASSSLFCVVSRLQGYRGVVLRGCSACLGFAVLVTKILTSARLVDYIGRGSSSVTYVVLPV